MKTEPDTGRVARVEPDGWHLWRVVDTRTGEAVMCGMDTEQHARGWARGQGWTVTP